MDNEANYTSFAPDGLVPHAAARGTNEIQAGNIPAELKQRPQWVCWKNEVLPNGKQTKVPHDPRTGRRASVNDRATWADFHTAVDAARAQHFDGVGFVLTQSDPYCIIDLDDKLDNPPNEADRITQAALLEKCQTYIELSPSGRGYHIVLHGKVPHGLKRGSIEIYSSSRYMTFTGNVVKAAPIADCQHILDHITPLMSPQASPTVPLEFNEPILLDAEVAEMARNAANGAKYVALCNIGFAGYHTNGPPIWDQDRALADCKALGYPSQSEADLALLSMICLYTRSNEQVRRLFRYTGLGRRPKASADDRYLDLTIAKVRAGQPTNAEIQAAKDCVAAILRSSGKKDARALLPSNGFVWGDDMTSPDKLRPSEWCIHKILPLECTALIYGSWGTCKTFVALDMAECIANGIPWHGKRTQEGTVLYLAGEGEGGFARRMRAWELGNNGHSKNIAFCEMPNLRDDGDFARVIAMVERMAAERGPPRAIVLDTLFTALYGADENSSKDMGELFACMRELRQRFRCAVIAVHHTGHEGTRARGHSSMPSGVDVQFMLTVTGGSETDFKTLSLTNPKQKDGSVQPALILTTEPIELPGLVDADGYVEKSLIIRAPIVELIENTLKKSEDMKVKAAELRNKGMSLEEIGSTLGRNKSTVSRWFR
jgi:putative DNA primase/helicase